jgi:hypothetical protein
VSVEVEIAVGGARDGSSAEHDAECLGVQDARAATVDVEGQAV